MPSLQSKSNRSSSTRTPQAPAGIKLITFQVGKLTLALPIATVYKVVNLAPVHGSGLNATGITQVGDRNVIVLDLHQRLFHLSSIQEAGGYFVLVQTSSGELLGIPTQAVPTLLEAPSSAIQPLPDSYRRSDTLNIASHIGVVPQGEDSITLFLLDVDLLID